MHPTKFELRSDSLRNNSASIIRTFKKNDKALNWMSIATSIIFNVDSNYRDSLKVQKRIFKR